MIFCRQMLDKKIQARGGSAFDPEQATEYVRQCYADASANADENGRIQAKQSSTGSEVADVDGLTNRLALLESLIEACRTIATKLNPHEATQAIVSQTIKVLEADRATIFILDPLTQELVLMVAEGARNIRVPLGKGIAGSVAENGMITNIKDAYQDERFDSSNDRNTGYQTKTILCGPIRDQSDNIVGVLQVINKKDGTFSDLDSEMLTILSTQAGIALKNAELFNQMDRSRAKFRSLLDIIVAMQTDMGTNSLIFTMTQRSPSVVGADRCTIFMVDQDNKELWAMQGEVNVRIPMNAGIAGEVATTGKIVNIPEAYDDKRFNQEVDKKTGYRTRSILCMPIKAGAEVVGVIQLLNKNEGPFDEEDEEVMSSFLSIAGPILKNSHLYTAVSSTKKTKDKNNDGMGEVDLPTTHKKHVASMPAFADDEEGDGGEDDF